MDSRRAVVRESHRRVRGDTRTLSAADFLVVSECCSVMNGQRQRHSGRELLATRCGTSEDAALTCRKARYAQVETADARSLLDGVTSRPRALATPHDVHEQHRDAREQRRRGRRVRSTHGCPAVQNGETDYVFLGNDNRNALAEQAAESANVAYADFNASFGGRVITQSAGLRWSPVTCACRARRRCMADLVYEFVLRGASI